MWQSIKSITGQALVWLRCRSFKRPLALLCALAVVSCLAIWLVTRSACPYVSQFTAQVLEPLPQLPQPQQQKQQPFRELRTLAREGAAAFALPRRVHYTSGSELLRTEYQPLMERWLAANPELEFYLWRDADAACLARLRYPEWRREFENATTSTSSSSPLLRTPLERSDLTRVLALHALGGLYIDLDTVYMANLTHLFDLPLAGAMFATEPSEHASLLFGLEHLVSNAVMFSSPGHPFLDAYLRTIAAKAAADNRKRELLAKHSRNNFDAPWITGPLVMQQVLEQYQNDSRKSSVSDAAAAAAAACSTAECQVHIFRPEVFCPLFDPMQAGYLRSLCNVATLCNLPEVKRRVCIKLWERNFSQNPVSNDTLAIHLFSHISSVRRSNKPAYFNASEAFPRLKLFANTARGC